ncbi:AraC-like DNA-binding protein [Neorhizobium galegae]|uniref:helix-turn-helix domain-containing protein n=1 Tax=Neorhizobium galegae TaxID=399 RepID=UPI001AEA26C5|nr:AraC family transcriptional regulator [Neorhizobium galegae]MBP2562147.1 AraC-like DNA-binding protein [Neorhizobium galegae]
MMISTATRISLPNSSTRCRFCLSWRAIDKDGEDGGIYMATSLLNPALLGMFDIVRAKDPEDLSGTLRVSERVANSRRVYTYQLQDRALWRIRFDQPIFTLATRGAGSILASYVDSSFATDVSVDGDEGDLFCFTTMLAGHMRFVRGEKSTTASKHVGLAWRPDPSTRLSISDDNARTNVFFKVTDLESALEHMLDDNLRQPLVFETHLDWSAGLAASLKRQLDFVIQEFQQEDGVVSSPVALASLTDLLVSLVLRGAAHNYTDRLASTAGSAVPAYVRRAEDFMRAHSAQPIRMSHVAAAAGCSLRTLTAVFNHFRGTTPLGMLHAIRLDLARGELASGTSGASVNTIARRYGFTNTARFAASFQRRFGATPTEMARRASTRGSGHLLGSADDFG